MVQPETRTVINLASGVKSELMESTRKCFIYEVEWFHLTPDVWVALVSMSNGNILCFNTQGQQVKLISQKLCNQSITQNRVGFLSTEFIATQQHFQSSQKYHTLSKAILHGSNRLSVFNGYLLETFRYSL